MPYFATLGEHKITSGYGKRPAGTGASGFHAGIDYVTTASGTLYQYPDENKGGVVKYAGWDNAGGGNMVWCRYDDGTGFYYLHCAKLLVKAGQRFSPNTKLSIEGNTGKFTSARHTHHTKLVNGNDLKSTTNFTLVKRPDMATIKYYADRNKIMQDVFAGRPDVKKAVEQGSVTFDDWWASKYGRGYAARRMYELDECLYLARMGEENRPADFWYVKYIIPKYGPGKFWTAKSKNTWPF